MKLQENFILVLASIILVIAIILRLTHTISSSTFGLIGLVFGLLAFVRSASSDDWKKEQPIIDLKEHSNPIKKRKNFVVVFVIILGFFYLSILIISILGQM